MLLPLLLTLHTCLPVEGDRILLRDLAVAIPAFAGADSEESIGFAPAPGAQRRFSALELNHLASRMGLTAEMEPVCFERKLETLTKEQVEAALRGSLPDGAELELIDFSTAQIPKGSIEFAVSGLTKPRPASPREPVIWRGRVKYSNAQSVSVWAKVRVWVSHPAAVAGVDLQAGKPIESSQIRIENRDMLPFSDATVLTADRVIGMVPRRPIRTGMVIAETALEASKDVTRGEMIGVETRVGATFLKFEVRAEASGRAGESIPVRNLDSGKTFQARVLRKGWVGVESTK